jgi:hypothetical protein
MPDIYYYRLLDPQHKGTIVKTEDKSQYQFELGKGWIRTGIMLDYFFPESDTFDQYEEITEDEASKSIQQ